MNREVLRETLHAWDVRIDEYSIDGEFREGSLCLERKDSGGWLVYYLDHGQMVSTRRFDSESDACEAFATMMHAHAANRAGVRIENGTKLPPE